jgi:hypothetical protein
MMTVPKQRIVLTPLEPYFFGGERIFEIGDGNRHYFIHSLDTPSQTMLFGVLRYLAIKPKDLVSAAELQKRYNDFKEKREHSEFKRDFQGFALNRPDVDLSDITGISPLYLMDEKDGYYIPVPFDHETGKPEYKPFVLNKQIETNHGARMLPMSYNEKDGLAKGWVHQSTKKIRTDFFESVPQVGIGKSEKAFFKKEYKQFNKKCKTGLSFAFFADILTPLYPKIVYMGQGKSAFSVMIDAASEPTFPPDWISPGMAYAQSDVYYPGDVAKLYETCQFIAIKTRVHRIFVNSYIDRTGSRMTTLIQAGSIFFPHNIADFEKILKSEEKAYVNPETKKSVSFAESYKHAEIAGFNKILIGGKAL